MSLLLFWLFELWLPVFIDSSSIQLVNSIEYAHSRCLLLIHHHLEEFLVVDQAILVLVHLTYQFINVVISERLVLVLETGAQLVGVDGARVVLVEILEGLFDLLFLRVVLRVHARCNELSVVDNTIVIRINY